MAGLVAGHEGGLHHARRRRIGLPRQRIASARPELERAEWLARVAASERREQERKLEAERPLRQRLRIELPEANHLAELVWRIVGGD